MLAPKSKQGKSKGSNMKKVKIRRARLEDIEEILIVEKEAWPEKLRATKEQFRSRIETFPGGTLVAIVDGVVVGVVSAEIVAYDVKNPIATWAEVTDSGFIKKTHNPKGDTLYGVDLTVSQFAENTSKLLMQEVGKLVIRYNLKQGILGARIPRYHKFKDKMTVEEYMNGKRGKHPMDPELSFYTKMGLEAVKALPNYIDDPESCSYGVLMVWKNPFYGKPFPKFWSWLFRIK